MNSPTASPVPPPGWRLLESSPGGASRTWDLRAPLIAIGRDRTCEVELRSPYVKPRHAHLRWDASRPGWVVESADGPWTGSVTLDGESIPASCPLFTGEVFKVADIELCIEYDIGQRRGEGSDSDLSPWGWHLVDRHSAVENAQGDHIEIVLVRGGSRPFFAVTNTRFRTDFGDKPRASVHLPVGGVAAALRQLGYAVEVPPAESMEAEDSVGPSVLDDELVSEGDGWLSVRGSGWDDEVPVEAFAVILREQGYMARPPV